MSRSHRKTPIMPNCGGRDRPARQQDQRRYRRAVRLAVVQGQEIPLLNEYSDPWDWPTDGKRYVGLEFTGERLAEVMRK